jgi:hypothetical protein
MPIVAPKKKKSLMPLLTVLFLISYGMMTLLIVEQNNTMQAQRGLIELLQGDSRELWAMKIKAHADQSAQAQAQSHAQNPSSQIPSTQAPSTHVPSNQVPLTQAPQQRSQSGPGKGARPYTQIPPVPASDLGDQRRVLITL